MATPTSKVLKYAISNYTNLTFYADGAVNSGDLVSAGANDGDASATADGDQALGVAYPRQTHENGTQENYKDGDQLSVIVDGIVLLEASATVVAGDALVAGADGTVRPYDSAGGDTPEQIIARAHEGGASGDRVEARLI